VIEKTFQTPDDLRLDLSIPQGTIDVETVDGHETHVRLECDDERGLDDARVELRGDTLTVEIERTKGVLGGMINIQIGSFSVGSRRYRLRITCPHLAELGVRTASADVNAAGTYRSAEVKTASGDVDVVTVAGDARVRTVSGDVRIAQVGGDLSAQSVSGDVAALDVRGSVAAKSVSGDVKLLVVEGDVGLSSVSGDIEVAIRQGSRVHVDATSVSGELESKLPLGDEPGSGDGPLVELRAKTVSGDVRVVRAPAASPAPVG
jgi:hypothetical protein